MKRPNERLCCPKCGTAIPDAQVRKRAASLSNRARVTKAGGRPPTIAPCAWCGEPLSAREKRLHHCLQKPPSPRGRPRKPVQTLEI